MKESYINIKYNYFLSTLLKSLRLLLLLLTLSTKTIPSGVAIVTDGYKNNLSEVILNFSSVCPNSLTFKPSLELLI